MTTPRPEALPDRWHRVHLPRDPECPYIVCKCEPTSRPVARTLTGVLKQAALAGFASHIFLFDGGQTITLTQPGVPDYRITHEWGDDEVLLYDRIEAHVAEHRRRREDDPTVQHEGTYL